MKWQVWLVKTIAEWIWWYLVPRDHLPHWTVNYESCSFHVFRNLQTSYSNLAFNLFELFIYISQRSSSLLEKNSIYQTDDLMNLALVQHYPKKIFRRHFLWVKLFPHLSNCLQIIYLINVLVGYFCQNKHLLLFVFSILTLLCLTPENFPAYLRMWVLERKKFNFNFLFLFIFKRK